MSRIYILNLLIILISSIFSVASASSVITGKVISVADGDTITILTDNKRQVKIRLYGIDTPESGQAFGKNAKNFTSSLTYRKSVSVEVYDTDRYSRSVGVVFSGNINVNKEILRNGYAWQYRKYCKASFCDDWLDLESDAKNARIGLWRDKDPVAPWEYRKSKRSNNAAISSVLGGSGIYHGNSKSHVLHGNGCQHYNCKNCTVVFHSVDDAVTSGYRPHNQCMR